MIIKVEYTDGVFVEFRSYKNTHFKGRMRDYEGTNFDAKSEDISLSFFLDFAFETTKEVKACYLTKAIQLQTNMSIALLLETY